MDEFHDKEDLFDSKRKRQKILHHLTTLNEEVEESDFLAQIGIGMLESDDTSSQESNNSYGRKMLPELEDNQINMSENSKQIPSPKGNSNSNDKLPPTTSTIVISKASTNLYELENTLQNSSGNIDIYTEPPQEDTPTVTSNITSTTSGRAIRNTSLSKINSANCCKKRSPLTTVSNNNILSTQQQELPSISSKKLMNFTADEKFFIMKREIAIQSQPNYFLRLSDEMILSVFKWLPKKALIRCSSVSKQFNRVAQDETLWTRLDLGSKYIRSYAMSSILSRCVVILRLSQAQITDPIFDLDKNISDVKLQYLDLSMAIISKPSLKLLLSKFRFLIKLSLEHIPINTDICHEISENKKLEALNLTMCEDITSQGLLKICLELTQLKSINVSWTSLDSRCVKLFVENITPNIMQLNIAGCRKTMNNQYVLNLVERCPDLLELDLSDCTSLTTNAVTYICKLKKLEYLSLSRCYNINVNSYFNLNNLTSLLYLDVFGLMNEQATQLLQNSLVNVGINKFIHSSVARPTVGTRRTSIWGLRTRDYN